MSYVITKDYFRVIQTSELNAITTNDISVRRLVEGSVQVEMQSYLLQKFNVGEEFADLNLWEAFVIYKGNNRVYLDAPAYDATATYSVNSLVLYQGNIYNAKAAITTPEAWNAVHWSLVAAQYSLYFVTLPQPMFSVNTFYRKGDKAFWRDKVYTATNDSTPLTSEAAMQAGEWENITRGNPLPDAINPVQKMWDAGVAYSVPAGNRPTDPQWGEQISYDVEGFAVIYNGVRYISIDRSINAIPPDNTGLWLAQPSVWTTGDNRNQMFVEMMLDMVVYNLCKRISPNNVPEARHNAWLRAIENLKAFAKGNLNAQLPIIQPEQGNRIRFGGNTKQTNSW